jgi:glutamyl-Q tRNA(Asp) synthetase
MQNFNAHPASHPPLDKNPVAYTGRFAPSPTGLLHQGSLFTAVASYLDARANNGQWLVRMEDLDPPREQAGAASSILASLEAHGLHWDGPVIFQNQRLNAYQDALIQLGEHIYRCTCNRQRLKNIQGIYDGHCQQHPPEAELACALRVSVSDAVFGFEDLLQGHYQQHLKTAIGDFVVRRKDGLFAYQLAVVADDIAQGITHVIRGSDLLDSSPRQCQLFDLFDAPRPIFGHLPVIINEQGQKLSKQNLAAPIDNHHASANMTITLKRLGHTVPRELQQASCTEQLNWASQHWQRSQLPRGLTAPQ